MSPQDQQQASEVLRSLKRGIHTYADGESDMSDPRVRIDAVENRQEDVVQLLEILCRAHGVTP